MPADFRQLFFEGGELLILRLGRLAALFIRPVKNCLHGRNNGGLAGL